MLTAHLPSGYVLARTLPRSIPWLMPVALVGAVVPDFDMIWFHLIDNRAIHHHRYWVHIPVFWLAVAVIALPLAAWLGWVRTAAVFFGAVFMHLALDTLSGGIMWGAPLSDHLLSMAVVPAVYGHWVMSFMLHWTFLLELMVWGAAIVLWKRRKDAA